MTGRSRGICLRRCAIREDGVSETVKRCGAGRLIAQSQAIDVVRNCPYSPGFVKRGARFIRPVARNSHENPACARSPRAADRTAGPGPAAAAKPVRAIAGWTGHGPGAGFPSLPFGSRAGRRPRYFEAAQSVSSEDKSPVTISSSNSRFACAVQPAAIHLVATPNTNRCTSGMAPEHDVP